MVSICRQTVTCHDLAPAASLTMWNMWNSERLNCGPYLHVGLVNWPLFISDQLVVCPSSRSAAAERVVLTFSAWSLELQTNDPEDLSKFYKC